MKIIIIALTLLGFSVAAAEDVPEYMKGGVITVTLKDGKTYTYSLDEYKVVRRGQKKLLTDPVVLAQTEEKKEPVGAGTRLTLLGGTSPSGLVAETTPFGSMVTLTNGFVLGGSIQVDLDDNRDYHFQFTGLSNGTFLIGLGVELK